MAKKDFRNIEGNKEKVNATTQSFFSESTLKKATEVKEEKKERKVYAKFEGKKNKTRTIALRLTEEQYEELTKQVNKTKSGTISNYIVQLLEKGL